MVEVLPDAGDHRALIGRVQETFRTQGLMPAMAVFVAGLQKDDTPPVEPKAETKAEIELPPQAAALTDRLVLACGRDSRGELPYRPAAFLAEHLGTELLHFPGGHTGLTTQPAEFGELLRETLAAPARRGL